jgi:hypothetical protein
LRRIISNENTIIFKKDEIKVKKEEYTRNIKKKLKQQQQLLIIQMNSLRKKNISSIIFKYLYTSKFILLCFWVIKIFLEGI